MSNARVEFPRKYVSIDLDLHGIVQFFLSRPDGVQPVGSLLQPLTCCTETQLIACLCNQLCFSVAPDKRSECQGLFGVAH